MTLDKTGKALLLIAVGSFALAAIFHLASRCSIHF